MPPLLNTCSNPSFLLLLLFVLGCPFEICGFPKVASRGDTCNRLPLDPLTLLTCISFPNSLIFHTRHSRPSCTFFVLFFLVAGQGPKKVCFCRFLHCCHMSDAAPIPTNPSVPHKSLVPLPNPFDFLVCTLTFVFVVFLFRLCSQFFWGSRRSRSLVRLPTGAPRCPKHPCTSFPP